MRELKIKARLGNKLLKKYITNEGHISFFMSVFKHFFIKWTLLSLSQTVFIVQKLTSLDKLSRSILIFFFFFIVEIQGCIMDLNFKKSIFSNLNRHLK